MSSTSYATLSNQAVMAASIIYVLAALSYLLEWTMGRSQPTRAREQVLVAAGNAHDVMSTDVGSGAPRDRPRTGRADLAGRIGVNLTVLAWALHAVAVLARGLAAHRVPWGTMYEFTLVGSLGVVTMYLVFLRRYRLRWLGLPVVGFVVTVLMLATMLLYEPAGQLVPALQSYWLVIHVSAAMLASGGFTLGAILSVLYLLKARAIRMGTVDDGYLARLPPLDDIDDVAFRVHAFAFPVWTFAALIAGPIWAESAWGRYWGWDPKEVWAFITWVAYAAYLHARVTAGWKGKAAAVIALLGFATLLFNFIGINFFFGAGSLHSYAGN